jgi:hypothetical protein
MQCCSICSALYVSRLAALCWAGGNDRSGQDRPGQVLPDRSMCRRLQGEARGMCKDFHAWLEWHAEQRLFSRVGGVVTCATDHAATVQPSSGSVQGARPGKTPVEL